MDVSGKDGSRETWRTAERVSGATPAQADELRQDWRFAGAGRLWDAELATARTEAQAGRSQRYCDCMCAEVLGELMECALDCGALLSRGLIDHAVELVDVFARPELATLGLSLADADIDTALVLLERHWALGPELTLLLHMPEDY